MKLADFTGKGYDKGRPGLVQASWFAVSNLIFQSWWFPIRLRPRVLRIFGATVGKDVRIRESVTIHWPWKLHVGDNVWIGAGVSIINLETVSLGNNVCVSQQAFLCSGSHDFRSPSFEFRNSPIEIGDECWIAARAIVMPGSKVNKGGVVTAGARLAGNLEAEMVLHPDGQVSHRGRTE